MSRGKVTSTIGWDERKNRLNQRKHNVSFEEAATVFLDPFEVVIDDPDHTLSERHFVSIGESLMKRMLVVSYVERRDRIRIISARKPTKTERRWYEKA